MANFRNQQLQTARVYKFPKSSRLLKRSQFQKVSRHGKRLFCHMCCIHYLAYNKVTSPKLGITVTKKFGNAVTRNKFKRKVRDIFRHHSHILDPTLQLNIRPILKHDQIKYTELESDILKGFNQLKIDRH